MRVYCDFESRTVGAAIGQCIRTLTPIRVVSMHKYAEVIITDNLRDVVSDKHYVLVRSAMSEESHPNVPENVTVLTKFPVNVVELVNVLSSLMEEVDAGKRWVLIFNPHHQLDRGIDQKMFENAVYGEYQRFDIECVTAYDFALFRELVSGRKWDLVLTDPFPTAGDFSEEAAQKIVAQIRIMKSQPDAPPVLVEECEGNERWALGAGADAVLSDWQGGTIAQAIGSYLPISGEVFAEVNPEDLVGGKVLKILVVDDNPKHQASARKTLAGHEVSVAQNFHQLQSALTPNRDRVRIIRDEQGVDYDEALRIAKAEIGYDVVLSDLLMPKGSTDVMGREGGKLAFDDFGYGYPVVFLAAKAGVSFVAVVTDENHHNHPVAYTFDLVGGSGQWSEDDFMIGDTKVMFRFCPRFTEEGGKDWELVLAHLLGVDTKTSPPDIVDEM